MAGSIGNAQIRVNPEDLLRAASELNKKISTLTRTFEEMYTRVQNTQNYWLGDASEAYRKQFQKERPETDTAFARIKEHVTDLQSMAAVYMGAETANVDLTQSTLESDVIV